MKKILISIYVIFMIMGFTATVQAANITATITALKGKAEIKTPAVKEWIAAKQGMTLRPGDIVKTLKASSAIVVLSGDAFESTVTMREKAKLVFLRFGVNKITGDYRILLDLVDGKLIVKTTQIKEGKSRYEVKTPTSVVDIRRGTVFVTVEDVK